MGFLFIPVYTELQIFGLETDGAFSDGGGYKVVGDDLVTGRIMVHGSQHCV